MDIKTWGDFLGICDQKVRINVCPVLNGYRFMAVWNLEESVRIIQNMCNKTINKHNTR